jgi:pyruvate dehydrogenase E2 component (dihydrolipoamide acetyltransferase)
VQDGAEAAGREEAVSATPLARRIARKEGLDLRLLSGSGLAGKVTKGDVSAYLGNAGQAENETAVQTEETGSDKVRATPAARRLAREHQMDLQAIPGSGREGRVQGSDVQAVVEMMKETAAEGVQERRAEPEIIPLAGMRQTIARRMTESYQQAPHIMLTCDIDMTRAAWMRSSFNARANSGQAQAPAIQAISMTAVIVKACAAALEEFPILNSYFRDGKIILIPDVNIGVAVALEGGLIVPVVHQANRKSLYQIGEEVAVRSKAAREGTLKPEDIVDGTFTISNLGMFGIDHFTAIINPPQVAILAVGQIGRRFVPDEYDQPVLRSMMTVTLSVDHRVVDGAVGAKFLDRLRRILESAGSQWG